MATPDRIQSAQLRRKIMAAEDAAALIPPGANVGMSGFTGAGHPKAVPAALAARIKSAASAGRRFRLGVWTGAATAPDLTGALAQVEGIELLLPYQGDPVTRREINSGRMGYLDVHLSHVAPLASQGSLGRLDFAVIEAVGVTSDGDLIPSTSVGNNKTWIDLAGQVIVEINAHQSAELDGLHDIYYGTAQPPHRTPIPITGPGDRIGVPHLRCPAGKIAAIVRTDAPDWSQPFKPPDPVSEAIAGHVIEFLRGEVAQGRLPRDLLPLQSGVGNVANAVLTGLSTGPFERLTAYTEVLQDGMLQLLESGKLLVVSATAFTLSQPASERLTGQLAQYRRQIILRPQEISNHPEVIRRLGCVAMNAMLEADIYGNVNSTHVMGTAMQNGIGGSGDFTRNASVSIFVSPSQAKGGAISCLVPMVSHVDHTEHDVNVIITEQGVADLRGLAPRHRARKIIDNCAHPDFRPALDDYFSRALASSPGKHTPHLLSEALSWHERYLSEGTMHEGRPPIPVTPAGTAPAFSPGP